MDVLFFRKIINLFFNNFARFWRQNENFDIQIKILTYFYQLYLNMSIRHTYNLYLKAVLYYSNREKGFEHFLSHFS